MLELGQQPFHLRLCVAIAGLRGGGDPSGENRASVGSARLLGQQLAQIW